MIDEILVHTATPATRQNDDLYRSLAEAYLDFEPCNTIRDEPRQELEAPDVLSPAHVQKDLEGPQKDFPIESSIVSTSRESFGSFPSYASSTGQLSGLQSRPVRNESAPTSSRLARLDRIHMHWKEQTTPRSSFAGGNRSSGRASRNVEDADTGFIEDTQMGAQALQSQLLDFEAATSEDSSGDETQVSDTQPATTSMILGPANATRDIVTAKLPSALSGMNTTVTRTISRQPAAASLESDTKPPPFVEQRPSKKQKTANDTSRLPETYNFSRLSIDAFPPAPTISIECPEKLPSQITKLLAAIQAKNPRRFNPAKISSTPESLQLQPDDRGYWSIACSDWPAKTQHDFWTSLCEHVKNGELGWGITLHRDASSPKALGRVRLYCWTEVVEHVWLLLWLCSKGEIVGSNSQWIDAAGITRFQVD
ncbi:hypothetical protein BDU57DRAFT_363277 [Ampelomyces quisqualis]|uniref:Uncharacterized protein n=1 Tax=Ampelomyces quisqualis TaxID=50730 RepID=A0A6A5QDW4_AMPQU|nr:hypothetical protein BDU57DRAFT_363277 [Ampelomyces quisqualis]